MSRGKWKKPEDLKNRTVHIRVTDRQYDELEKEKKKLCRKNYCFIIESYLWKELA